MTIKQIQQMNPNRLTEVQRLIQRIKELAPIDLRKKAAIYETLERFGLSDTELKQLDIYFVVK